MKWLMALLILIAVYVPTNAQGSISLDKEQLLRGEDAGQTLIADTNGFPSPKKILALKDQLGLTKVQLKKIDEMLDNLSVSATVKGQEIVEVEDGLGRMFISGNIVENVLRTQLERIGKMRAELRFMHLQVYLKTKKILLCFAGVVAEARRQSLF